MCAGLAAGDLRASSAVRYWRAFLGALATGDLPRDMDILAGDLSRGLRGVGDLPRCGVAFWEEALAGFLPLEAAAGDLDLALFEGIL